MAAIKEDLNCFQYMFFYIFIIISFVYLSLTLKNLPNKYTKEFLIKAMDYWKKKPIWKMKVINVGVEEPNDMNLYSFGKWPGTYEGCNCSENYYNDYSKGACSNKDITNHCTNVEEREPININIYYFKYFVTYYDSDYLDLLSRVENDKNSYLGMYFSNCKTGYKRCGILDNVNRPFCVKEEEDCVINQIYFIKIGGDNVTLYYGFNENLTYSNVINNIFVADYSCCLLNEVYLSDNYILFKNETDKLENCSLENKYHLSNNIPNSEMSKSYLYKSNNIYDTDIYKPSEFGFNGNVNLRTMSYYGLNSTMTEFYYGDVFVFRNLLLYILLIFIILKLGIQLLYFIFIKKVIKDKKKAIIYNILWTVVFISYLIVIYLFNNSLYRNAQLVNYNFGGELHEIVEIFRIIDIILAFIILFVHCFKLVFIIVNKGKIKFSEFINPDK